VLKYNVSIVLKSFIFTACLCIRLGKSQQGIYYKILMVIRIFMLRNHKKFRTEKKKFNVGVNRLILTSWVLHGCACNASKLQGLLTTAIISQGRIVDWVL
jgi:hypothetical protein